MRLIVVHTSRGKHFLAESFNGGPRADLAGVTDLEINMPQKSAVSKEMLDAVKLVSKRQGWKLYNLKDFAFPSS